MYYTPIFDEPEISPWGEIQHCEQICRGVYQVSTASRGGVMLKTRLAQNLLSPEARKCGFREGGYTCFEEDCQAAVVLLELLDKGVHKTPKWFEPERYREVLEDSVKSWYPQYWRFRERTRSPEQAKQIRMWEGR